MKTLTLFFLTVLSACATDIEYQFLDRSNNTYSVWSAPLLPGRMYGWEWSAVPFAGPAGTNTPVVLGKPPASNTRSQVDFIPSQSQSLFIRLIEYPPEGEMSASSSGNKFFFRAGTNSNSMWFAVKPNLIYLPDGKAFFNPTATGKTQGD